jgi:hypothetical protein
MKNEKVEVASVQIDVAPADLLDRLTVLEIKSERLTNEEQLSNVRAELAGLRAALDRQISVTAELRRLSSELRQVNETLWDLEEVVRACDAASDFGERFVDGARSIIHANNRRAALKRAINRLLGARFQEEKSHPLPDAWTPARRVAPW